MITFKQFLLFMTCTTLTLLCLHVQGRDIPSVSITENKTTSVVFPTTIINVDRGSDDVLAQKVKGAENVLQLKAARQNFPETNVTVITGDGKIYQFAVLYEFSPGTLVVDLNELRAPRDSIIQITSPVNERLMERLALKIARAPEHTIVRDKNDKMSVTLKNIYARDKVLFFSFSVENNSVIPFEVDYFRFYIVDQVKVKRTARQQLPVIPIYKFGTVNDFPTRSHHTLVFAFEKFTIPDAKRFVIEIKEKNGGRHLSLTIRNRTIVRAQLID